MEVCTPATTNGHHVVNKENGQGESENKEVSENSYEVAEDFDDFEILEGFDSPRLIRKSFPVLIGDHCNTSFSIPAEKNLLERKIQNRRALYSPFYFSLPFSEKSTLSEITNTSLIFKAYLTCTQKFNYKIDRHR